MKGLLILVAAILLLVPFNADGNAKKNLPTTQGQSQPITIPPAPTQTIPNDVSFQLGQQSGKIDDMSKRLDNIEKDIKEISQDTGRLNVYASIAGVLLLAIIAPLIYKGIERWVFKTQSAS